MEVYDDSQMMIFKPRDYAREKARRERLALYIVNDLDPEEPIDSKDQSCIYELLLCGSLRRCMFFKQNDTERAKKRARFIGLSVCTVITLCSAVVMELCNRAIWAEWFPTFQPHYSEELSHSDDQIKELEDLNWTKTLVCGYVIIFALLLRVSFYICLVLVATLGSPIFAYAYCQNK